MEVEEMKCFDHDWKKIDRCYIPNDIKKGTASPPPVPENVDGVWLGYSFNEIIGSGTRFDYWEAEDDTIWMRAKETGKREMAILNAY